MAAHQHAGSFALESHFGAEARRAQALQARRTSAPPPQHFGCAITYPRNGEFQTCCTAPKECRPASACSGSARSTDAIMFVVQKSHATYDATHDSLGFLTNAIASLVTHYKHLNASDLLLWHEGDFVLSDLDRLLIPGGVNARLCLLDCCTGWGPPPSVTSLPYYVEGVHPPEHWAAGYFFMIRFYSITMFSAMHSLGYRWAWRMDDDSVVRSTITYNLFESMRTRSHLYGWRQLARFTPRCCHELTLLANATPELQATYVANALPAPSLGHVSAHGAWVWADYCRRHTDLGFYNNFFVTSIEWWRTTRAVRVLQRRFEESRLIFTRRLNDLVFQSVVVQTLLPPLRRRHFLDFGYDHTTIRNGSAFVGGFESAYTDADGGLKMARAFKQRWRSGVVRNCSAPETADAFAPNRKTYYVAHHGCPVCEQGEGILPHGQRIIVLPTLWESAEQRTDVSVDSGTISTRRLSESAGETPSAVLVAPKSFCTLANVTQLLPRGSAALDSYLAGVYGKANDTHYLAPWEWSVVEVIHLQRLPIQLQLACTWPSAPLGRGSVFTGWWAPSHYLWVYHFERPCAGVMGGHGDADNGRGGYAREVSARWVEVTHEYQRTEELESEALFLTLARGSGVWYYTGKTLLVNDASRLETYMRDLNMSAVGRWSHDQGRLSKPLQELRRRGFASVILNAHVDWEPPDGRCQSSSFYKRELISLRLPRVQYSCPPDPMHMAWGWPTSLQRPCVCVPNGDEAARARGAPVWGYSWPYQHIECDTSGSLADHSHWSRFALEKEATRQQVFQPTTAYAREERAIMRAVPTSVEGGAPHPRNIEAWA